MDCLELIQRIDRSGDGELSIVELEAAFAQFYACAPRCAAPPRVRCSVSGVPQRARARERRRGPAAPARCSSAPQQRVASPRRAAFTLRHRAVRVVPAAHAATRATGH